MMPGVDADCGGGKTAARPLVSVIMNCLNCGRHVREAVESVLAQTYDHWEIIFWDNASGDDSAARVRSYDEPRLRYFRGETTVPLGEARNLAIARSRGDLIAFLDCDDIWLPEKLARQVPLFLADDEVGLVYSDSIFFNERGATKRALEGKSPYRGYRFGDLLNDYLVSLETAMIRRRALDSLDRWFDPRFNVIEEHDLFLRIGLGWKVDYVPEPLAKWRIHGESWTWKTPDAFVHETGTMLADLRANPAVAERHAADLSRAADRLLLRQARMHWRNGDPARARRTIAGAESRPLPALAMWLASFLPYRWVEAAYIRWSRTLTPGGR